MVLEINISLERCKRLVLCISEPYIERKAIMWKKVNARFLSSMNEALACDYMSHCCSIYIHSRLLTEAVFYHGCVTWANQIAHD